MFILTTDYYCIVIIIIIIVVVVMIMISVNGILVVKRLLGRLSHTWENNVKMHLKYVWRVWTGLIWLKVGSSGSLL